MVTDQLSPRALAGDILDELAEKNHVTAIVYRAVRAHRSAIRTLRPEIVSERVAAVPMLPALHRQDRFRMLQGKQPIYLNELLRRIGRAFEVPADLVSVTPNLRTTVGADFLANVLGLAAQPDEADWIALSQNTATPAAGDSSASTQWATAAATDDTTPDGDEGEFTALGMARKIATYAHTNGTAVYTMSATWTATATVTLVRLAGLFGGSAKNAQGNTANNILFLENTFTATTLANNDQLSLTWTVNI